MHSKRDAKTRNAHHGRAWDDSVQSILLTRRYHYADDSTAPSSGPQFCVSPSSKMRAIQCQFSPPLSASTTAKLISTISLSRFDYKFGNSAREKRMRRWIPKTGPQSSRIGDFGALDFYPLQFSALGKTMLASELGPAWQED